MGRMGKLLTIALIVGAVAPARAEMDREQALNVCLAQPMLRPDNLAAIIDEQMAAPHDPSLDRVSKGELIDTAQAVSGQRCAAALLQHPDVFRLMIEERTKSDFELETAWVAFNTYCRDHLTPACVSQEIAASLAIRASNSSAGGMTSGYRSCSLALSAHADLAQVKRCMDAAGGQQAGSDRILSCAETDGRVHALSDGAAAGRRIAACFRKGDD